MPSDAWSVCWSCFQYFLPVVYTWRGHLYACNLVLEVRNSKCWELSFCRKGQIRVSTVKVKL